MADSSSSTTGRRFLRPPSAVSVSRKSHSFNAADRNKIKGVKEEASNTTVIPNPTLPSATNAALLSGQSEWRSKSLNAKHSFTSRAIPTSAMPSKLAKKSNGDVTAVKAGSSKLKSNSPTHLVKVQPSTKAQEPSGKQRLVKMKSGTSGQKDIPSSRSTSGLATRNRQASSSESGKSRSSVNGDSKLRTPAAKSSKGAKGSGLVPPKTALSRSASNSSRSSNATTASPDRKGKTKSPPKANPTQSTTKSSGSVLGRLRKIGSPSTTIPNNSTNGVTLKQAMPVKSPSENTKSFPRTPVTTNSMERREKRSLVPPSKLAVSGYKSKNTGNTVIKPNGSIPSNSTKQSSGIKSTFQRAFGGPKEEKKGPQQQNTQSANKVSPASKRKALNLSNNRMITDENEVIVISNPEEIPKRYSGDENYYRRDKIDVKNLKNLLVRPYDNARNKKEDARVPSPVVLSENDMDLTDDEDLSKASMEIDIPSGVRVDNETRSLTNTQNSMKPNHESGIRNIQLPSSSDERKPHKTATVAPFRRQIPNASCVSSVQSAQNNNLEANQSEIDSPKSTPAADNGQKTQLSVSSEKPAQISVNASASMEVRRKTAKGIADLRQNLEETMCSLRNSQLRNRMSDEFERRISAQLDAEIEEVGLPEVPPPLSSHGGYRSASAISGIHTISHGTRSPKLHAGECLGPSSYTSPRPGKYSSLHRTQSSRTTRTAWNDTPEKMKSDLGDIKMDDDRSNFDDISSVSSEDLSEYIAGVSTDDISLSSTNNSPFHCLKTTPLVQPPQKSALANIPVGKSTESLEKSSNSTTSEGNRSLSSWKKSKASLKSSDNESKSKKKLEKKNSSKGLKESSGSPAVGSRLATVERSESPTSVKQPAAFNCRGTYAYRSLPRSNKSSPAVHTDLNQTISHPQASQEGFVRSPALKILLRSKANKSKMGTKSTIGDVSDIAAMKTLNSMAPPSNYMSSTPNSKQGSSGSQEKWEEDLEHRLGFYSSLERKNLRTYGRKKDFGMSMSATQSLPRRFAKRSGNTTWSAARSNANSAYSLPVTPDENIYNKYNGSYVESNLSYSESANSFSSLTVPEYDNFSDAMDKSFHDRHKIADWPLSGLQPSSAVTASSPNVARAALGDRSNGYNYRTIASTHDILKRRGSTLSLGGALNGNSTTDETSIAMARTFFCSANMVDFEKSLSHLTTRLRELATSAEEKDVELNELRNTIEQLKRRSSKSEDWQCSDKKLKKKPSCGSLSSMSSQTSISSAGSIDETKSSGKKKRHWLRNSFKTAFGKTKSKTNLAEETTSRSSSPQKSASKQEVMSLSSFDEETCDPETVRKLKEELRQKERKLTDIRLEALTSRHQLQHLQDTMTQMKNEMESLRKENEQLHQLGLSAYSLTSSSTFLHSKLNCVNDNVVKTITDEMKVKIVVEISNHSTISNSKQASRHIVINSCPLPKTINWSQLDQKLTKIFSAYCQTVDPTNCLKLTKGSLDGYSIGDGVREIGAQTPDLLPCGYLVGDTNTIVIKLRGSAQHCVDLLAFELLIDKNIVEKYVDMVIETHRVIICGPTGTGKSLLANRLAGYVANSLGSAEPGTVIHMDAKQKAPSELQDFLHNISGSVKSKSEGPTVVVLDNLQSCKMPHKLLEPFCAARLSKNLFIICVTNEKTTDLQEFCWIMCSNNSPPVQTFLARTLRRSYLEHQISQNQKPDDVLSLVITWLPKCWQHINDFLEFQNGSEVTIGPRMFSSCPMDAASARVWFTDLWNFSVVPYVISAIKRSPNRKNATVHWSDPTDWVLETMPWRENAPNLNHIRPEDVGPSPTESDYSASLVMSQSSGVTSQSSNATSQSSSDPLLNMLMRLQEAANYDSDTNSSHDDGFELSIDKALTELGS